MSRLVVNGVATTAPDGATVASLVGALGHDQRGIAVAVNDEVVPRSLWERTRLLEGDRVEILTVAQGG